MTTSNKRVLEGVIIYLGSIFLFLVAVMGLALVLAGIEIRFLQ